MLSSVLGGGMARLALQVEEDKTERKREKISEKRERKISKKRERERCREKSVGIDHLLWILSTIESLRKRVYRVGEG